MSDIVERLRDRSGTISVTPLLDEAAAEIERLQARELELIAAIAERDDKIEKMWAAMTGKDQERRALEGEQEKTG